MKTGRNTLAALAALLDAIGAEALLDRIGDSPSLVVRAHDSSGQLAVSTPPEGVHHAGVTDLPADTIGGGVRSPYAALSEGSGIIVPVVKSDRNPFAGTITVGRATNNDIILLSSAVSKLHAFFANRSDGWYVVDQNSTNRTKVNDVILSPKVETRINFGDAIEFGGVGGLFVDPTGLIDLCELVKRDGSG
jgi:hypothetical protein